MDRIKKGRHVEVVDALGVKRQKVALSDEIAGRQLHVVLLCDESEWKSAQAEHREPLADPFAWPVDSIVKYVS